MFTAKLFKSLATSFIILTSNPLAAENLIENVFLGNGIAIQNVIFRGQPDYKWHD